MIFLLASHSHQQQHNDVYCLKTVRSKSSLATVCMLCVVVSVCRVQCVASHVQKGDLDRTVHRSVSVTTMASVYHPLDSVCAALDTQENGERYLYYT